MKQPWWAVFWARLGVGRRVTCLQRWNEGVGWGSSWTQTHTPTHSRREMHRHWNLGWPSPAPVHAPCGVDRVDSPPTPSPCICPAGLAVWTLQAGSQAGHPPLPAAPGSPGGASTTWSPCHPSRGCGGTSCTNSSLCQSLPLLRGHREHPAPPQPRVPGYMPCSGQHRADSYVGLEVLCIGVALGEGP